MKPRVPVAVMAATGTVGQRLVSLLADHPWFEVVLVTGSDRSAGQPYGEVVRWTIPEAIPESVRRLRVDGNDADLSQVGLVFSALPAAVARDLEPQLAQRGKIVCTNASALRMEIDVPLLIPEINLDHLDLIHLQRARRGWTGLIVASPNCAATGLVFPLKALHDAFGVRRVHAVTMQAISGAGYPGVAAFDIQDNIIPFIQGEEAKIEAEPLKILGSLDEAGWAPADLKVSAQTHRVPVLDGHLAAISVELDARADLEDVRQAIAAFRGPAGVRDLPSAPAGPMVLHSEAARPQPRRDRDAGAGMVISVGRVQRCSVLDFKMVSLVHNTLRGAASGALLNAEALVATGHLASVAA